KVNGAVSAGYGAALIARFEGEIWSILQFFARKASYKAAFSVSLNGTVQHIDKAAPTIFPCKCVLAGNSVHEDRRFLAKHMPRIINHLHYRIVDVSTIKELCRRWYPTEFLGQPKKMLKHRALDDILESIQELKYYKSTIFKPREPVGISPEKPSLVATAEQLEETLPVQVTSSSPFESVTSSPLHLPTSQDEIIFPELMDCTDEIGRLTCVLASGPWVKMLNRKLKERNIITVGQLCALPPSEIEKLDIQPPKIPKAKSAMQEPSIEINGLCMAALSGERRLR
ncbi:hypothetical protein QYM36_018637, partial [Artemia franciscana]